MVQDHTYQARSLSKWAAEAFHLGRHFSKEWVEWGSTGIPFSSLHYASVISCMPFTLLCAKSTGTESYFSQGQLITFHSSQKLDQVLWAGLTQTYFLHHDLVKRRRSEFQCKYSACARCKVLWKPKAVSLS